MGLKELPISAPSRSRRCCVRSSSIATSAATRPIATEPGTTTVWASRVSVTAWVSAFAMRCASGSSARCGRDPPWPATAVSGNGRAGPAPPHSGAWGLVRAPGRGETRESVAQPVREPRAIGGEVGVVAVENAQLLVRRCRHRASAPGGTGCGPCRPARTRRRGRSWIHPGRGQRHGASPDPARMPPARRGGRRRRARAGPASRAGRRPVPGSRRTPRGR